MCCWGSCVYGMVSRDIGLLFCCFGIIDLIFVEASLHKYLDEFVVGRRQSVRSLDIND
jgi:hypothetical protein